MQIFYPYNEILPKKTAHDIFIFHECTALAERGYETTLLCGKGTEPDLFRYYGVAPLENFHIKELSLIRKNNPLNWSWNFPFFYKCQKWIQKKNPEFVFLSVLKQGAYHLSHKIKKTRYIYEVHELSYYPNQLFSKKQFQQEKDILSQADLVVVTTSALKEILRNPPYNLSLPIEVIPLAVAQKPLLSPPKTGERLTVMYVGQLYKEQGISFLLAAMQQVEGIDLKVIGGKCEEVNAMKSLSQRLGLSKQVEFLGFQPPNRLSEMVSEAHAFICPFEPIGKMPFVAHTKLQEYAAWGRPIIAPNLSVVEEHFPTGKGVLFFEPGDIFSLVQNLQKIKDLEVRNRLQKESLGYVDIFSWQKRAESYCSLLHTFQ